MGEKKEIRLDIQMLGGFSVACDGKEIVLGRNYSAKFIQLLQLIWLKGENGIEKEQLMEALYDREKGTNRNATFNTMLSRARKTLKEIGFPGDGYIIFSDGLYRGSRDVKLNIDAVEFRTRAQQAEAEKDEERKVQLYEQAFELYRGELLPEIATEFWVTLESFSYMKLFEKCVNFLGEYGRKKRDYHLMERVYAKAASIYPFEEWQSGQIEAMLGKGELKKARNLYDETVQMYLDEEGVPISRKMAQCDQWIEAKTVTSINNLLEIQKKIEADQENSRGVIYCQYSAFVDIYQLMVYNMERVGNTLFLMLCMLTDYEGKNMQDREKIKKQSKALEDVLCESLSQGDVFTKYSTSQYLVLLSNTTEEGCKNVFSRIKQRLKEKTRPHAKAIYYAIPVNRKNH